MAAATRHAQRTLSPLDVNPARVNLDEARRRIKQLQQLGDEIPIQKVNEAYERMVRSDLEYRFCIDMASLKAE